MTTTTNRSTETWAETQARYLATYGVDALRAMAGLYRLDMAGRPAGTRALPLRYAIAARVVASLGGAS